MAFLGGLFGGGGKTTTTTSTSSNTSVNNMIEVEVGAEISPIVNINPEVNTAVDLTGFSEAVGKVAEALNTVVEAGQKRIEAETSKEAEKAPDFLSTLSKVGGGATAILALLAVYFAFKNPDNVKVQL